MKRIVYPGSFDPIHHGHLAIARAALAKLEADEVIFLLSPSTVWKKVDTPFRKRLEMLKIALESETNFSISALEEENEGKTNFTYVSLEKLKLMYPDDELFLLIGADQAAVFDKWSKPDLISSLATPLVYMRKGSRVPTHLINEFKMQIIPGEKRNVSSSEIRFLQSVDTPLGVLDYIILNKLYFAKEIAKKINEKRYFHSYEVAKLAMLISNANNRNPLPAFQAGMLHDIAKDIPKHKQQEIMEQRVKKYTFLHSWAYHQFIGEIIAKEEFGIQDQEVLKAIKFHATGYKKMSPLMQIVYASDKIEPTRGFDSSDLINACVDDYYKGFVEVVKANKEFLESKDKDVHNVLTVGMFKKYLK